jgi:hypothetical protein
MRNVRLSRLRANRFGPLPGETKNVLAAWVGNDIYIYSIERFRNDGLIDKQLRVRKAPAGFGGFVPGHGLSWKTNAGRVETLTLQQ